jgi:hypothetical protein
MSGDAQEIQLLKEMIQHQSEAMEKQNIVLADISKKLAEVISLADCLSKGFPGGDPNGHRVYHEALIHRVEARAEFWQKLLFELTKWGVILFIGWAFAALWRAAISVPKP